MTNGDKIRQMTDEELAVAFVRLQDNVANSCDVEFDIPTESAVIGWLDWMRKEANDG